MKLNFSLDAAVIVTSLTALLYMVGQAHFSGYIRIFGADLTILNLSIQDKLYYGYLRSLTHSIYLILTLIVIFLAIPSIFKDLGGTQWLRNKIKSIRDYIHKDIKHKPTIYSFSNEVENQKNFNRKFYSSYLVLILITALPFYLAFIENDAKDKAKLNLNDYATKMPKLTIKERTNEEAYKILCGQNLCAVLVVNGKEKSLQYIDPKEISFPLKSTNK